MFFPENQEYDLEKFHKEYSKKLHYALNSINPKCLEEVYNALSNCIVSGSTVFTCGNGGSSSIAEHLVCDFVKGSSADSNLQPKIYPLLSTPLLTAIANDISYKDVFSFQIEHYSNPNDVLLSVSSSGNSENITKAIKKAQSMGLLTISFVGFDGGKAKEISDIVVHVKTDNYGLAEDAHHALMHIFAQYIRLKAIVDINKLGKIKF